MSLGTRRSFVAKSARRTGGVAGFGLKGSSVEAVRVRFGLRLRQVVNVLNTSTLVGLTIAKLGRAHIRRGPDGLVIATDYRLPIPPNPAFTVGNVVMVRDEDRLVRRPTLLAHEARHATQYAWCVGPVMWIPYAIASAWSWVRTGDPASRNWFERRAGLAEGGYLEKPVRPLLRRRSAGRNFPPPG
jgi:hypothetical protein